MLIIRLTSAVASRAAIYINADHIISFTDQVGGCQIKTSTSGTGNVIAVTESSDVVIGRIEEAREMARRSSGT